MSITGWEPCRWKPTFTAPWAELNAGFETVILEFGNLKQINYFRSDPLTAMYNQLLRIRAQANREFIAVLSSREAANSGHFEKAKHLTAKTQNL